MIIIKTFTEISNDIKKRFYDLSKIDVKRFSVFDMLIKSISYIISEAYEEIEKNKKPYLFTRQEKDELDSTGLFLSCPREEEESDENYLYRLMNWVQRNAACNKTAIEDAFKTLKYSTAYYVPYTKGIGSATIFVIPESYDEDDINKALNEAKEKLEKVLSPSSIVDYSVPEQRKIKLVAYLDISDSYSSEDNRTSDINAIKNSIITEVKEYINSIPPGERLMVGDINRIGLKYKNVEYFNIIQVHINGVETSDFEIMQEIDSKFIFDEIIWWEVEK